MAHIKTERIELTNRTRKLGFGWTNSPEQVYNNSGGSYLRIPRPDAADMRGSLKAVESAFQEAGRINNGNDWNRALFVDGKRIEYVVGYCCVETSSEPREGDGWDCVREPRVARNAYDEEYTEAGEWERWDVVPHVPHNMVGEVLRMLRDEGAVTVEVAA